MPEAPVAPAPTAPAPAAAAPSTPAPAAPSTPAAPAPPAASTPAAPVAPSTPAKFDPKTSLVAPNSSDYPDTQEGIVEFGRANSEWAEAHPEEAAKARAERMGETLEEAPKPDAAVAEAVAKVEGEQPAEAPKPAEGQPPAAATPVKIDEWTAKSPELKAAFDKNPELRTEIMEMARGLEAAKPVLDIVGTAEEAQFAVEHANRLVSLQSNWMLSGEDPEMVGPAWEQTVEMFKERDANGAEIKGPDGKPKLGADFKPFVKKAASTALQDLGSNIASQMQALQEQLKGVYPSEEAKEAAETQLEELDYSKKAIDYVLHQLSQPDDGRPQLPALPANATEEQKAFQKQLEERERLHNEKTGKTATADRKAASQKIDREVSKEYETGISTYIDTQVAAMKERGEYLPEFVLSDKWINPQTQQVTKVSDFGMKIFLALNAKIFENPTHRAKLASLQALGASGKEARTAELKRLQTLYLPKIFQSQVQRIQDGIRASSKQPAKPLGEVARKEPQSQGTVVPSAMGKDEMRTWAETEAKKDPSFAAMSGMDREALIMSISARKRFGG